MAYSGLEQFFSHTARFQSANRTMLAVLKQNEDALLEDFLRVGTGPHTQPKARAPEGTDLVGEVQPLFALILSRRFFSLNFCQYISTITSATPEHTNPLLAPSVCLHMKICVLCVCVCMCVYVCMQARSQL